MLEQNDDAAQLLISGVAFEKLNHQKMADKTFH
jgi:hypothetical protein